MEKYGNGGGGMCDGVSIMRDIMRMPLTRCGFQKEFTYANIIFQSGSKA